MKLAVESSLLVVDVYLHTLLKLNQNLSNCALLVTTGFINLTQAKMQSLLNDNSRLNAVFKLNFQDQNQYLFLLFVFSR